MLLSFDRQVSILVIEDVVVQHIVVASLFFEKFPVHVHVLFIWVHASKVAPSFVLQHAVLDHVIVGALGLSLGTDREGTLLVFLACPLASNTV